MCVMNIRARIVGTILASALGATGAVAGEGSPSSADLVDALNAVFGKHPGARGSHAKGICVKGTFRPDADASRLSKAPQFQAKVPVLARFSLGGGNPKAADNAKANVRGFAMRFNPDGDDSDLVMVSTPVFFARTPEQFIEFLKVRVPVAEGSGPDQDKIKAFAEAHPETTSQGAWLASRPVPASYAGVNYWAIHAFTLTNAEGQTKTVKFKAIPAEGEEGLTDEEAKTKGTDFYAAELKERLAEGAARFKFVAMIGEEGDPTDDPTAMWDEDTRTKASLGTLSIEAFEEDTVCDAITFDPTNLAAGVEGPKNDLIFGARSGAYAVSLSRRISESRVD
jgi:catalase